MGVHKDAPLACELPHPGEQFARATERDTRRKAKPYSTVRAAVPTFKQFNCYSNRFVWLLLKARRHISAAVHHALTDGGPKTSLFDDFENFFCVADSFHRQGAGS